MGEIWLENARIAVTRDALGEDRMGRKLIDISAALRAGIKSDPPTNLPEIEYSDHHQTAHRMADYMGIRVDQLPNGEYCASERVRISNS